MRRPCRVVRQEQVHGRKYGRLNAGGDRVGNGPGRVRGKRTGKDARDQTAEEQPGDAGRNGGSPPVRRGEVRCERKKDLWCNGDGAKEEGEREEGREDGCQRKTERDG